ncbi:hypothetical protein [Avibacterium avium]|uniref:hypothetical protein n=1 Tax=Avibacterium avium TaxID=751 RepID=UPI003BF8D0AB
MNSVLMQHCPKCRKVITTTMLACPNCGFSLDKNHLAQFRQQWHNRYLKNQEINRKSNKLHLIWLAIFAIVIAVSWVVNG